MAWTKVTNPTVDGFVKATNPSSAGPASILSGGTPIGLLLALTYTTTSSTVGTTWTKTTNPTISNWIKVTNPS